MYSCTITVQSVLSLDATQKRKKIYMYCNLLIITITLSSVTLLTVEYLRETCPVQLEWGDITALKISE